MAQPLAYMMNRRSSNEAATRNLYAQLQAPDQRVAVQSTMNNAVSKGVPTITDVLDPFTGQSAGSSITYNPAPSYSDARRAADVAAYKVTIDPTQLARGIGNNVSPSNIANAYINPVAENAYDYTPLFDWSGRQVAGAGSKAPKPTRTDSMMYDLAYGRDKQAGSYQDAINKAITAAEYQQGVNQVAYEMARQPKFNSDASYNLQRSLGSHALTTPFDTSYEMPGFIQQQYAELQKSQTQMSPSFYRGGHDNPSSFPAGSGYRL